MRDSLLQAEYRDQSVGVFQNREVGRIGSYSRNKRANEMAFDLVSTNKNRRTEAMQALEDAQITPSEIVAKAYTALAKYLQPHECHIAAIEGCRRKLRGNFERLKAARARPIEEA